MISGSRDLWVINKLKTKQVQKPIKYTDTSTFCILMKVHKTSGIVTYLIGCYLKFHRRKHEGERTNQDIHKK